MCHVISVNVSCHISECVMSYQCACVFVGVCMRVHICVQIWGMGIMSEYSSVCVCVCVCVCVSVCECI